MVMNRLMGTDLDAHTIPCHVQIQGETQKKPLFTLPNLQNRPHTLPMSHPYCSTQYSPSTLLCLRHPIIHWSFNLQPESPHSPPSSRLGTKQSSCQSRRAISRAVKPSQPILESADCLSTKMVYKSLRESSIIHCNLFPCFKTIALVRGFFFKPIHVCITNVM